MSESRFAQQVGRTAEPVTYEVELAGMQVAIRRQDRHSAPTLAFRFDDQLAWIEEHGGRTGTAAETLDRWKSRRGT